MLPTTPEEFRAHVDALRGRPGWVDPEAFGLGLATVSGEQGKVLDTYFPAVNLGTAVGFAAVAASVTGHDGGAGTVELSREALHEIGAITAAVIDDGRPHPNSRLLAHLVDALDAPAGPLPGRRVPVITFIRALEDAPVDAHDVYLRLHLLSHRMVQPHGANLDGVFGLLSNVVWTDLGPVDPEGFEAWRTATRAAGRPVTVYGVDKFPRMVDYVLPSGVRIADADRVRLGAHLAEGTTVMHEGFVNFNAGTLGPSMVEGRISSGVVVGPDSDIGGGASIMGTLSGGGKEVITVGSGCLLGANAGIGISLGDRCVVEAGLYVTAGTLVTMPDGTVVKARELSGRPGLLFRRNSVSGAVEVHPHGESFEGLNTDLHANE